MHDAEREQLEERIRALESEIAVLRDVHNTPIVEPFALAAACEAKHQRLRHGDDHDARKDPWDWYWTLGYLGAKAARAHADGDIAKALHHTVTTAALLANWHRHLIAARPEAPATRKPDLPVAPESMSRLSREVSQTACVFEVRNEDGTLPTSGGFGRCAWCRTHGFDCPHLSNLSQGASHAD